MSDASREPSRRDRHRVTHAARSAAIKGLQQSHLGPFPLPNNQLQPRVGDSRSNASTRLIHRLLGGCFCLIVRFSLQGRAWALLAAREHSQLQALTCREPKDILTPKHDGKNSSRCGGERSHEPWPSGAWRLNKEDCKETGRHRDKYEEVDQYIPC